MGQKTTKHKPCNTACPECAFCETFDMDACETFWNEKFRAEYGTSGDSQRNDWRYDYNTANQFIDGNCQRKEGQDLVTISFCTMQDDKECTKTVTLEGRDVEITSTPAEEDCISTLCEDGSTKFAEYFDKETFDPTACSHGSIRGTVGNLEEKIEPSGNEGMKWLSESIEADQSEQATSK